MRVHYACPPCCYLSIHVDDHTASRSSEPKNSKHRAASPMPRRPAAREARLFTRVLDRRCQDSYNLLADPPSTPRCLSLFIAAR